MESLHERGRGRNTIGGGGCDWIETLNLLLLNQAEVLFEHGEAAGVDGEVDQHDRRDSQ